MIYKIIECSVPHFKGITLDFDFSNNKVGDAVNILGLSLNITQIGSDVIGCSNSENILFLQKTYS